MHDIEGSTVWSAELNCYGQIENLVGKAKDCPFRYPGQYEGVETGLHYNRFRYYSPEEGMNISQDPIGLEWAMPNLYSYVPETNIQKDPFGLCNNSPTRQQRIAELTENNAQKLLNKMSADAKLINPNTHFLERHGSQTTMSEQMVRARTGLTPDGHQGHPVDSTKFLTARDQLRSIERAKTIRAQTVANVVNFNMESIIGDGYRVGGGSAITTNKVRVVFKNGLPYTTFPIIR